jgi:hypothetical protein
VFLTGSAAFSSVTSYVCTVTDESYPGPPPTGIYVNQINASEFQLSESYIANDVVGYICVGS